MPRADVRARCPMLHVVTIYYRADGGEWRGHRCVPQSRLVTVFELLTAVHPTLLLPVHPAAVTVGNHVRAPADSATVHHLFEDASD